MQSSRSCSATARCRRLTPRAGTTRRSPPPRSPSSAGRDARPPTWRLRRRSKRAACPPTVRSSRRGQGSTPQRSSPRSIVASRRANSSRRGPAPTPMSPRPPELAGVLSGTVGPATALRHLRSGRTPAEIAYADAAGIKVKKVRDWIERGLSAQAAASWSSAGFSASSAAAWAEVVADPEVARLLESVGFDVDTAREQRPDEGWTTHVVRRRVALDAGASAEIADDWAATPLPDRKLARWVSSGVRPSDVAGWLERDVRPAEAARWSAAGFSPVEADAWRRGRRRPRRRSPPPRRRRPARNPRLIEPLEPTTCTQTWLVGWLAGLAGWLAGVSGHRSRACRGRAGPGRLRGCATGWPWPAGRAPPSRSRPPGPRRGTGTPPMPS